MYRLGLYQSEQLVAAPLGSVDAAVVPHVLRSLPFLEVLAIHLGMNIFTQNQNRWTKKPRGEQKQNQTHRTISLSTPNQQQYIVRTYAITGLEKLCF
jgi:hypothetical protein